MRNIATTIALTTLVLAAEPETNQPATPEPPVEIIEIPSESFVVPATSAGDKRINTAKQRVLHKIARPLTPKRATFSRSMVPMVLPMYERIQLVNDEERLPFTIHVSITPDSTLVSGYVRLSDYEIFILDPKKGKHISSASDPRFAEPKARQPAPKKIKTRT